MNNRNVADKLRKTDITLVIRPLPGLAAKNVTGMVDRKLFTGENHLHAIMDTQTCLWRLAYDNGTLPNGLKDKMFTGFHPLYNHVNEYLKTRNAHIESVID